MLLARALALVTVLLLVGAAAACGDDGSDGEASGDRSGPTEGDGGSEPTTSSAPGAEPACTEGAVRERTFVLCTAGDEPDQDLVVALHGRGSSAQEMRAATGLDRSAAAAGLAIVFPDGVDRGWGDDHFTSPARPAGDEDVRFLDDLIEQLRADPRIGDGDVGVVGFSNGASMALRYAADRPDDVRAVVSVAGQLPRDPAVRPSSAVPLLEIYGTDDPLRGYETGIPGDPDRQPGEPTPTLSTVDTVAAFVDVTGSPHHEGPVESDPTADDGTRLRTESWTGADGTVVVLRSVVGGGHTWPSAPGEMTGQAAFGPVSRDLDASQEAIAFLTDPGAPPPG